MCKHLVVLDDSINTDSDLAKRLVNIFDVHMRMLINRIEKDDLEEKFKSCGMLREKEKENER
jgi:hypothetical protein